MSSYFPQVFARTEEGARKGVTHLAQRTGDIFGQPKETGGEKPMLEPAPLKEAEAEKSTPEPAPPEVTLENLLLLPEITQLLEPPLEKLGYSLKEVETTHDAKSAKIKHHVIETNDGKIVLIYIAPEVLKSNKSDIKLLGYAFIEDPKMTFFIFSDAEDMGTDYDSLITSWQRKVFKKMVIYLQKDIERIKGMEAGYLQEFLKDEFALPDDAGETESGETAAFEHQKLLSQIEKSFNHEELNKLCFELDPGLSFDDFRGRATLQAAIIALIQHFQRQEQLPRLVEQCKIARPDSDWDVFPKS